VNKILVTGANGFIGKALVSHLNNLGRNVVPLSSVDGNIADRVTLAKFLKQDIVHVYHLAAKTFVPDSWVNSQAFYQTNVIGTVNVLEFCRASNIPLTYVSAYVYGHPDSLPIREDSAVRPSNPYAMTKWLAEQVCNFYANTYDLPVTTLRLFNVYGIGQAENFIIPLIISQVLDGGKTIIVKDLIPKRDYIYIEDVLAALLATLNKQLGYNVYNVGSGTSLSVQEVINIIQNVAGTEKKIICDNVIRSNELMDVVADISKAENIIGWKPKYSFQQGVEKILSSNYKN
jgi:nucleoside-diphosphate-sugar epimerase